MIGIYKGRALLFSGLVGASLGLAAAAAAAAYCVQLGVDAVVGGGATVEHAWRIVGAFGAIAAAGAILEVFRARAGEQLGLSYVAQVRSAMFERLLRASPASLAQRGQGGLLLPFVGDLTAIKKWVSDGLVRLISATATSILLITVLAFESMPLGLSAGVVVAVAALVVYAMSSPLNRAIRETRMRRGAVAAFVSRSIRAADSIRAFHRFDRETRRLGRRNDALMRAGLRLATTSGMMSAVVHVAALALIAVTLAIGAAEVGAGAMTIGVMAASISIAGLLAGAVRDLGMAFELWRRAAVSFDKIEAALNLELAVEEPRGKRAPKLTNDILVTLRRVAVNGLMEGVSAELVRGEIVNVVGESGAGKSTLLSILARLRDPDRGQVKVGGRDVRYIDAKTLRGLIGFAGAATPLLAGSVAMNLRYRSPRASDDDIAEVVAFCHIQPIIDRLPGGMGFRLSEGAPELSIAERQRLLIARAMLGRPHVLILDDVDTHIDAAAASSLAAALSHYEGVVVMAANASELKQLASVVWRLENGKLQKGPGPGRRFSLVSNAGAAEAGGSST